MTVSFQLTAQDFRDVLVAHRNRNIFMRWVVRLIVVASVLALLMVLTFAIVGRANPKYASILENLLPLVILAIMWIVILLGMPSYVARKQFRNMPTAKGTIELESSESGVHLHSQHSDSNLTWSAFLRWMETKTAFALYTSPYMFWIIPKRAFSGDQVSEFRETLVRHIATRKIG